MSKRTIHLLWLSLVSLPCLAADLTIRVFTQQGEPLENAVVFLKSDALLQSLQPMPVTELSQNNRTFTPNVLVITKGSAVEFPNRDRVRHHVYSFSNAKTFELKLYSGRPEKPVVFDKAGVVEIGCNIHDSMLAWILVSDTPLFAKTNNNGEVHFTQQPADTYQIEVWHSALPFGSPLVTKSAVLTENNSAVEIVMPALGGNL
ncbi:methylamine utilization protein [Vibrio vulnificus]|uniref:methylamine utilization protein n=1 Tax=Vibrio vulnificus TaxID=672 RepID=UPI0018EF19A8|nr:methylamine utilization protein [Vibrio vulnificus]MCG6273811.1 methylamine utilization protein [Vibrio vulnificus]MCU8206177.1 methylamine utilization protein [Vibrio vulnificus]